MMSTCPTVTGSNVPGRWRSRCSAPSPSRHVASRHRLQLPSFVSCCLHHQERHLRVAVALRAQTVRGADHRLRPTPRPRPPRAPAPGEAARRARTTTSRTRVRRVNEHDTIRAPVQGHPQIAKRVTGDEPSARSAPRAAGGAQIGAQRRSAGGRARRTSAPAPRESASIPSAPLPANRSRTTDRRAAGDGPALAGPHAAHGIAPSTSKIASRTRSEVGPRGAAGRRLQTPAPPLAPDDPHFGRVCLMVVFF